MGLIILLIFILLIALVLNYLHQKDFIAPTFLVIVSFLMASVIILMNTTNWMIHINGKLILCVLVAIVAWFLGSALVRIKKGRFKTKITKTYKSEINLKYVRRYPINIMHALSLILTFVFFLMMLSTVDKSGGITSILRNLYQNKATSTSGNFLLHQVNKAIVTIAYLSVFQLLSCIFIEKNSKMSKFHLVMPVIYAMLCTLVSSDRNVFIRFCVYCLCLWILFFKNRPNASRKASNKKILKYTIILVIAMALLFYGMGKMKQYTSNLERMIGIYGGSGLYNFNLYLENFNGNYTFGRSTFNELIGVFAHFGMGSEESLIKPVGFITYLSDNGYVYSSNIYSALQPYYADFGVFGIFLFCFILAIFFEYLYQKTDKKRYGFHWVFYATFIYPTIYMAIAEQTFSRIHLGLIYELFWLFFFYIILYDRKKIFGRDFYLVRA